MGGGIGQQSPGNMNPGNQVFTGEDMTSSVGDLELLVNSNQVFLPPAEKSLPSNLPNEKKIVQSLKAAVLKSSAANLKIKDDVDAAILGIEEGTRLGDNGMWS